MSEMSREWEKDARSGLKSQGAALRGPISLDPAWELE